MSVSVPEQVRIISAGAVNLVTEADLVHKLERGTPLRVKLGLDPSRPDIHIGHAVVLQKLRRFQELGHIAVLIVGDFTAQVGDPSNRSSTRPALTREEADANAATYFEQAQRILLPDHLEIRHNSEWLAGMGIDDVLRLTARMTVARMLERDDFARRYAEGKPISIMEFLYPLLQGWDSVMVQADVELGGTDQLFNNLMGRTLQEQERQEPQVVLTMPLLEGLDGVQKMSKSLDNYVGITEPAGSQFGKLMSIPDDLMTPYFALATGWGPDEIARVDADLASARAGDRARLKRLLARTVVDQYHGTGAGAQAEEEFDRVFKEHAAPTEVPEHVVDRSECSDGRIELAKVLRQAGLVPSNKEGRRQIAQGAVRLEGEVVDDPNTTRSLEELDGKLAQVGRRRWARLRSS